MNRLHFTREISSQTAIKDWNEPTFAVIDRRVLALFEEERGKPFDPRVVDAFMAVLPQIQNARRELSEDVPAKHAA